ncbi:Co2+/Mg2+ efflux protein ApaG [Asticcacaulis sp. YBE204]|uniref:Co2+/Mg2+ efflux protein ApaG n=1 Tax=Asticcacaulis sp. YBE204 TaxID=1282363 RepID=UPI0003C41205|nr:Co2+/Mg2+ efflux protein ApaG [Asticcacaulis sp. YBE204]ESQ81213.1 hypothetical protein AEYBE204_02440 [Asticcacaulis sp. YBE204]
MMLYSATTHDVTVSVRVQFVPRSDDAIAQNKWLWTYHITLKNDGETAVRLKTRHWTITDALGRIQTVEGVGVVGETPLIAPGESYAYSSGCPLDTSSGAMGGHYMFVTEDGHWLKVTIPDFSLDMPETRRVLN